MGFPFQRHSEPFLRAGTDRDAVAMNAANGTGTYADLISRYPDCLSKI
jgi:hypothetical protein